MDESTGLPYGVMLRPRLFIPDDRGWVQRIMRPDDVGFVSFGEVYLSCAYRGVVKGWHLHKRMTLNYIVVSGIARVFLYDDRPDSPTVGMKAAVTLRVAEASAMLTIPPGVWNAYRSAPWLTDPVVICNVADLPHDPEEIERRHPEDFHIAWPPEWGPYWMAG